MNGFCIGGPWNGERLTSPGNIKVCRCPPMYEHSDIDISIYRFDGIAWQWEERIIKAAA